MQRAGKDLTVCLNTSMSSEAKSAIPNTQAEGYEGLTHARRTSGAFLKLHYESASSTLSLPVSYFESVLVEC